MKIGTKPRKPSPEDMVRLLRVLPEYHRQCLMPEASTVTGVNGPIRDVVARIDLVRYARRHRILDRMDRDLGIRSLNGLEKVRHFILDGAPKPRQHTDMKGAYRDQHPLLEAIMANMCRRHLYWRVQDELGVSYRWIRDTYYAACWHIDGSIPPIPDFLRRARRLGVVAL